MLLALEGSSPTTRGENNYQYYVWHAYLQTKQPSKYIKGPSALSSSITAISVRTMADKAKKFIKKTKGPIQLIGWSRGAAACIQVALDLFRESYDRNIESLFLFDAVDQDTSTPDFLNFIPANVENVYHAIATKKTWRTKKMFPTCGRTAAPNVKLNAVNFYTTHGGIAGADKKNGDAGSAVWMWSKLKEHKAL